MPASNTARVVIENVNHPGKTETVDKAKYDAMKAAILKVTPKKPPGLTVAEIQDAVLQHLPDDLYPGGEKSGWWMKAVQLDLEAKKIIARAKGAPVRLHKL